MFILEEIPPCVQTDQSLDYWAVCVSDMQDQSGSVSSSLQVTGFFFLLTLVMLQYECKILYNTYLVNMGAIQT